MFTLPQRRHRVWGVASLNRGMQSADEFLRLFVACLEAMQSTFQFPMEMNFPKGPREPPQEGRHALHVSKALAASFYRHDIFVDCAGSEARTTWGLQVLPCLTENHPIYSVQMERYIRADDALNAQGIWKAEMREEAYAAMMSQPKLARDMAGNSFSSTVAQVVLLASLISCSSSWTSLVPGDAHPCQLQRIRNKRPAPEYPMPKKKTSRFQRFRRVHQKYKKKTNPNKKTGKKGVATIWQKEQLSRP